jgi:ABC-type transport system substrate-binding protein
LAILLIVTSFAFLNFNPQNTGGIIDDSVSNLKTNDLVYVPFTVGVSSDPQVLDPADCWDVSSWNVIDQVCEGFFRNNLSDPDMSRENWLAESYWWENETTLHLKLRESVLFHDSTPFDSTAAKWNLDRINYLANVTGTLPGTMEASRPNSLWRFPNGTGIMKQIDIINQYNITIHLNSPFSPFLSLLSMVGAYMISPASHSQTDYIDLNTGDLVGTGPFEYDGYNASLDVHFHAFDSYWRGKANITRMKYSIIGNYVVRNDAMLNGDIDYLYGPRDTFYSTFDADPNIVFTEAPKSGLVYYYVGMNNEHINVTWRKAISYAINYSYIIQEMRNNHAVRAYSPIASGFGDAYYDCSGIAPYHNLTIARQTLIDDPGIDTGALIANDNPDDVSWEAANLGTFNYTYFGTGLWADMAPLIVDNLADIGITVPTFQILDGNEYYDTLLYSKHEIDIFTSGWGPDYLEAFNFFGPLFSNSSLNNWASVNDPWLQMKIEEAIKTTDDSARNTIYQDIQIYMSSNLYPHAFLYHRREYFVYDINLANYPHNALGRLFFYPCEWTPDFKVIIDSPTDDETFVDIAPMFTLTIKGLDYDSIWYTLDNGAMNTTCGISGQIDQDLWNGLADGSYTLRFYANNSLGNIATAAITIHKDIPDPIVIIFSPTETEGFAELAPIFTLTIVPTVYDSIWYTLDDGATNTTCGISGQIDPILWSGLADGPYTLRFYANNSYGRIGTAAISIYKDATDPVVIINDPDPGHEYNTTIPSYDITITEIHPGAVWYTMDNGVTTIPITTYSGSINAVAWLLLPNGPVTITFYAIDAVGNIGFSSVIVNKNTPDDLPPEIPGPIPFLILLIMFTGIIGLVWKQKQKLN